MAPVNEKKDDIRIGVYACTPASHEPVEKLIAASKFSQPITFYFSDYEHTESARCDIAIMVFSATCDIKKYQHDVAMLKVVKKVSHVMAFVWEDVRDIVEQQKTEVPADDIFYLPISITDFTKIIVTHLASVKIARDMQTVRPGMARNESLGEILVRNNLINPLQLKKALEYQKNSGKRLGDVLVELGFIDHGQKLHFLSSQLGVPLATPRQYASADLNVVALIPEQVVRRHNCIALEKEGNELIVAMTDVLDLRVLDSLRDLTDCTIRPVLGELEDITTTIDRYYRDISSHKDASELMADLGDKVEFLQESKENVNLEEIVAAGAELGIVKLVNMLIANAVRDRASDIHIEPMESELVVRYRIDGDLRRIISPPRHSHQAIVTRIKILSNLDIAERRLPQDGRMVVRMGKREVDMRISILPSVYGEKVVMRILDKEAFEKSVANLGFSAHDQDIFKTQILKPYGMVIVTGPTGSGKSTTLYSALQQVKNVTRNVITVEDPVEFHIEGVTQVHVNTKIGLTFGIALRSILRQDPDVVLIGEIRDNETADIAIKMSMTGHLVFSTLHTNDAAGAIARFVDIGIPPLLLASSLNLIVAQRLVRRVCQKCKEEYAPALELIQQLRLTSDNSVRFYRGIGCVACNGSGFMGRVGIFEMLQVSREIRTMILRNASTIEIQDQAEKEGMRTLRKAGIELALKGDTTIEQVIAATTEI